MISFFIPGGIIFLLTIIILKTGYLDEVSTRFVEIFPLIIMASSVLFGTVFKKSRLVLGVIVVLICGLLLYENYVDYKLNMYLISFCLPLNMFIIYNLHDRGIFKLSIVKYLFLLLAQTLVYIYISRYEKVFLFKVISEDAIDKYLLNGFEFTQASLIVCLSVLIYLVWEYFLKKELSSRVFFWSLVTSLMIFYSSLELDDRLFIISCAGFILLISFIMSSYDVAYKDKLTDLPARRSFDEYITELGNHYAIGMVDIDFFKKFNDKYGHDIGDQVLKLVAGKLAKIKGGGRAFRYGGEEFAVVFDGRDAEYSYEYLENLRQEIENQEFKVRGKSRPRKKPKIPIFQSKTRNEKITVSIGIAEKNDKLENVYEVIKAADTALYKAKREGRNRVCCK